MAVSLSLSGVAAPPVHRQRRRGAAKRPGGLSDKQPRAASHRAALREHSESVGARGERRPALLFGLYTERSGGASHHPHPAGGKGDRWAHFPCMLCLK